MFSGWYQQLIATAIVMSLCVVAAALPTVIEDADTSFAVVSVADVVDSATPAVADFIEPGHSELPACSELADAGRVLCQPFNVFGGSATSRNNVRRLPKLKTKSSNHFKSFGSSGMIIIFEIYFISTLLWWKLPESNG